MKTIRIMTTLGLVAFAASNANAELGVVGSDTVEFIMKDLIRAANGEDLDGVQAHPPAANPPGENDGNVELVYLGGGSGNAASAMERDTGERTGYPVHQIGPMSRALEPDECVQGPIVRDPSVDPTPLPPYPAVDVDQVHIGNDDILNLFGNCSSLNPCAGNLECADGICVDPNDPDFQCATDNDCSAIDWYPTKGEYQDLVCVNNLCTPPGGDMEDVKMDGGNRTWRYTSLLLYFGVDEDGGATNCNSAARRNVVETHNINHVYRRDDASGTTADFKRILGVTPTQAFCNAPGVATIGDNRSPNDKQDKDPIRVPCDNGEDVCSCDGTLGLLLPILPPAVDDDGGISHDVLYPSTACSNAAGIKFSPVSTSGQQVITPPVYGTEHCSDGSKKVLKGCVFPKSSIADGSVSNCMYFNKDASGPAINALLRSNGLGLAGCPVSNGDNDVRSLNLDVRMPDGANGTLVDGGEPNLDVPDWQGRAFYRIHSWSQHDYDFDDCGTIMFPNPPELGGNNDNRAVTAECQELDATLQIGCLVGRDARWGKRSRGFAGLQAIQGQCAADLNVNGVAPGAGNYPFSRKLYINVMKGVANVSDNRFDGGDEKAFMDFVFANPGVLEDIVNRNGYGGLAAPQITANCGP